METAAKDPGQGRDRFELRVKNTTTDLFPELAPAASIPTMPKPESRRAAVLEALRRGERLTHIDALQRGWGWRLAADVFALSHDHGWPIKAAMVSQSGGNEIALYWMPAGEVSQ